MQAYFKYVTSDPAPQLVENRMARIPTGQKLQSAPYPIHTKRPRTPRGQKLQPVPYPIRSRITIYWAVPQLSDKELSPNTENLNQNLRKPERFAELILDMVICPTTSL